MTKESAYGGVTGISRERETRNLRAWSVQLQLRLRSRFLICQGLVIEAIKLSPIPFSRLRTLKLKSDNLLASNASRET
jgi:hypothetical protein